MHRLLTTVHYTTDFLSCKWYIMGEKNQSIDTRVRFCCLMSGKAYIFREIWVACFLSSKNCALISSTIAGKSTWHIANYILVRESAIRIFYSFSARWYTDQDSLDILIF